MTRAQPVHNPCTTVHNPEVVQLCTPPSYTYPPSWIPAQPPPCTTRAQRENDGGRALGVRAPSKEEGTTP